MTVSQTTIARPYARAAFDYAFQHRAIDSWDSLLAFLSTVISHTNVKEILGDPRVMPAQMLSFLSRLFQKEMTAEQTNFLKLLIQRKRLQVLPEIFSLFEALKAEQAQSITVDVRTAMPLSDAQKQSITQLLATRLAKKVALKETVEPELLGGAVIRAGDLVIDTSAKGLLRHLATQLMSQA